MLAVTEILIADEAWVALALLHREHPERESFSAKEIMDSAGREKAHAELRAGLQAHIYLHNVANVAPNSAQYRMFYRMEGRTYRLFRPGDERHPDRKGKMAPRREELPAKYHPLLDWYDKEYSRPPSSTNDEDDPVLRMWGVGKDIWKDESGDAFIARERAEFDRELQTEGPSAPADSGTVRERTWKRIVAHQGSEFHTVKNLPFTYSIQGDTGIWFERDGKRIDQRLGRGEVDLAISMCPVSKPSDFARFRDPSYLFGLLMDRRIRGKDW